MKVCYEDNHIIIVYKPRNLLSQKDYTNDSSLVEEVKEYLNYLFTNFNQFYEIENIQNVLSYHIKDKIYKKFKLIFKKINWR